MSKIDHLIAKHSLTNRDLGIVLAVVASQMHDYDLAGPATRDRVGKEYTERQLVEQHGWSTDKAFDCAQLGMRALTETIIVDGTRV